MNIPNPWTLDTADAYRESEKRDTSPGSFFYSQGQSIMLAASYFTDSRLTSSARGGVAKKHRHRLQLALFGQLMASFEFLSKDIIAKSVDMCSYLDVQLHKATWINLNSVHVLSTRNRPSSPGSILIGHTQGWHQVKNTTERFVALFGQSPILSTEERDLDRLWILRHSVAHNAGYITPHDAFRISAPTLSAKVAAVDEIFIKDSFNFLSPIARRMVHVASESLLARMRADVHVAGLDFERDKESYIAIRKLGTYLTSRRQAVPEFGEADYTSDMTSSLP